MHPPTGPPSPGPAAGTWARAHRGTRGTPQQMQLCPAASPPRTASLWGARSTRAAAAPHAPRQAHGHCLAAGARVRPPCARVWAPAAPLGPAARARATRAWATRLHLPPPPADTDAAAGRPPTAQPRRRRR
eukprot:350695-Chlamydomonas_euryale.AAC.1